MVALHRLPVLLCLVISTAAVGAEAHADYAIFRNGERVGHYSFTINKEGSIRRVHARMRITVKILGVAVYQASHERHEVWDSNRLMSMKGRSLYNEKSYEIALRHEDGFPSLEVNSTRQTLGPEFFTFVPWLIERKGAAQLITEKGRLIEMTPALRTKAEKGRLQHCVYQSEQPRDAWYDQEGSLVLMTYKSNNADIRLSREEEGDLKIPTK